MLTNFAVNKGGTRYYCGHFG